MQKKLMAVAVAGALGAPALAFAQASTVQIYGTVYVEWSRVDGGPSAAIAPAGTFGQTNVDFIQTPGSAIDSRRREAGRRSVGVVQWEHGGSARPIARTACAAVTARSA